MTTVTIHQAKTNLSKLIAEVEAGGEVIIARGATPVVKLVLSPHPGAVSTPRGPSERVPGRLKGKVALGEGFFDPLPDDELALWNGEGD